MPAYPQIDRQEDQSPAGGPAVRTSSIALALTGIYLATGTTHLGIKLVSQELAPVVLTVVRLLGAAVLLMPFSLWRLARGAPRPTAEEVRNGALSGVLLLTFGQVGTAVGVAAMPAGVAAVIGSSAPLFLAVISVTVLREPLPARHAAGVVIGFLGIGVLTLGSSGGRIDPLGVAAILAASASWAIGSLYGHRVHLPVDPVIGLNLQLLVGGILAAPLMLWPTDRPVNLFGLSWSATAGLGYLMVTAIAAFFAFNWLNINVSSTSANSFTYVAPIVALALGALLLGETITLVGGFAAALALAGVVLMVRRVE